jgi:anti-sigma regulatory factor (Ser/Thr protein kinase)
MPPALMTQSEEAWNVPTAADPLQFAVVQAAADPKTAGHVRAELGSWLRTRVFADAATVDDILLAVYEAFANAAEYAYLDHSAPGTVDVQARVDSAADILTVTITDRGHWRQPRSEPGDPGHRFRGRGIPLMRALASEASISTTAVGTQVSLTWRGLLGDRPLGM